MPSTPINLTATPQSPTSILLEWENPEAPYIVGTDGIQYHVLQIPCSIKEYTESIGFARLRNELSDGFRAQTLYGSNTGLRRFNLTMPTLQGGSLSSLVQGVNGEQVTKEEYIWGLYCENQVTGTPFVIESQRNNQYYLVEFVDQQLSYQRLLTKLYSTGVELSQVRIDNVSIFQPDLVTGLYGYWDSNTDFVSNNWDGTDGTNTQTFVKTGDVIDVAAAQNGQQIKRFNDTTNNGYVEITLVDTEIIYDVIMAVKYREATFSNDAAVFSNAPDLAYISGDTGTTKFNNPGLDVNNFHYSLNGVEYAQDDMQAPMNVWGVCHFRNLAGWNVGDGMQIGGDGVNFAEMDLGDVCVLNKPSMQTAREIIEHLVIKCAAGT